MKEFWDERYSNTEFVYGKEPNLFFKEALGKMDPGKILLPAEGEGRNAIYAALKGWDVYAFDNSIEGKKKALQLANEMNVSIKYDVLDVVELTDNDEYDCVALVFAHFPKEIQQELFKKVKNLLKIGGKLIVEAYNLSQLENGTGGPQKEFLMYRLSELETVFSDFDFEVAENKTLNLSEGLYHQGKSDVVRFVAKKK